MNNKEKFLKLWKNKAITNYVFAKAFNIKENYIHQITWWHCNFSKYLDKKVNEHKKVIVEDEDWEITVLINNKNKWKNIQKKI
jgi:hypothetical protein